jgi:hypothetical protein
MAIDEQRLNEYLGRFVVDLGATVQAATVLIGDKLGLYRALAEAGPSTPAELAERTGTGERYVAEWLRGQAAGGYVSYDPQTARYHLDEIQAFTLVDEDNPVFLPGAFHSPRPRCGTSRRSPRRSGPALAMGGTSTTPRCSPGASGSSARATTPTWSTAGCRPAPAWWTSWRPASAPRTSAAGSARPP